MSNLQMRGQSATRWSRFAVAGLFAAAIAGCGGGSDGAPGPQGIQGVQGIQGLPGKDLTAGTVDALQLTYNDLLNSSLSGKILDVDTSADQPVVKFQVVMKDTNQGLKGLRTFSLHLAQLQPEKDGSASYWLNYLSNGLPLTADPAATSAKSNPSSDSVSTFNTDGTLKAQGYKVVDGGDGTYTVTFGANVKANPNVVYDPNLVHRVVVGVRSVVVPGVVGKTDGAYAGPLNPTTGAAFGSFTNTNGVNLIQDFVPATKTAVAAARDNVTVAACNQCHGRIEYGFPRGNNTSGHFGSRPDTKTCVMCHTPQNTNASGVISASAFGEGDFTNFVHKIHMGAELGKVDTVVGLKVKTSTGGFEYPQDIRNCAQCHKGTVANSWQKPTLKVCGSCHNAIDFTKAYVEGDPTTHVGGVKSDDKTCALCHDAADITTNHIAVIKPDTNSTYTYTTNNAVTPATHTVTGTNANTNASYVVAAGVTPPTGAIKISYAVTSVTRNATTGNPSITFKFQQSLNGATPTDVVFNDPAAKAEMIDNFVGSPSVYFAWSVAQDGIAAPADYNATASTYIKNLWRGDHKDMKGAALAATSDGTMVKNTDGTYTITLTGVNVVSTAKMLTGGVGYTYSLSATQPLTQINLAAYPYTPNPSDVNSGVGGVGGLSVPPANVWKVATGFTGRRLIVDNAKCNSCHGALGVKPTFHAGQRNDAQTCTFCHTVNRTNSGWPVSIGYDVHAIHNGASGQRVNKFSWEVSAGAKFWEVKYPGQIKNCESCHIAGMYDYSASTSSAAVPNMLMTTAASGTMPATVNTIVTGLETVPGTYYSPFVTANAAYGSTFSYNANTNVTTEAADTTLVLTPISAACSGCHDSTVAKAHMENNGGVVFGTRVAGKAAVEQCLVCHGPVNNANFNQAVPSIKAVHRWW